MEVPWLSFVPLGLPSEDRKAAVCAWNSKPALGRSNCREVQKEAKLTEEAYIALISTLGDVSSHEDRNSLSLNLRGESA